MKRFLLFAAILSVSMLAWAEYPSSRWKNVIIDNNADVATIVTGSITTGNITTGDIISDNILIKSSGNGIKNNDSDGNDFTISGGTSFDNSAKGAIFHIEGMNYGGTGSGGSVTVRAGSTSDNTGGSVNIYSGGISRLHIAASGKMRLMNWNAPDNAVTPCTAGEIAFSTSYIYFCISDNAWKRSDLSTW